MVVVGVDAHKRTHTLVAVDEVGRKLGERTVSATRDGHLEAITWAARWTERQFALEDCRHLTRLLEANLLAAGEAVVRVPPQLMAGARRSGRERGSPTLSMHWRLLGQRFVSRTSRLLASMASPARYASWSTIARIWSPNALGYKADCAGIYTSCSQAWRFPSSACGTNRCFVHLTIVWLE